MPTILTLSLDRKCFSISLENLTLPTKQILIEDEIFASNSLRLIFFICSTILIEESPLP